MQILQWVLSWFGAGPLSSLIQGGVDLYKAKLTAGNSADTLLADMVGRELALQTREAELQAQIRIAEIGKWYEPDKLMGYAVAIYFGKLLIIDKVLGLGTTDALAGWASTTANLIVMFYFGKRGVENIAKILAGRWK